jgi:SHS family sialic acid transporter-like MFS transporter
MNKADANAENRGKWMALIAAFLGWMFDGFEIGMFPVVGPSALDELLGPKLLENPTLKGEWFGVIMSVFLVGAATGGVVFGWLGDRIGRVRAMSLSILTYAIFTGLCGLAGEAWHIAVLRFIASLGMGGERALGVALVTEIWPDNSRTMLAGLIGAASNIGMLLVGLLSLVLVSFLMGFGDLLSTLGTPESTVEYLLHNDGWRLMMITGALPAVLVFFIRLFVPESGKWESVQKQGATSHWATRDLLGVVIGALGAIAVITVWSPFFRDVVFPNESANGSRLPMLVRLVVTSVGLMIAFVGYIYPVLRYMLRAESAGDLTKGDAKRNLKMMLFAACLAGIPLLGTWGSLQWAPKWAIALAAQLPVEDGPHHAKEWTQIASASGAVIGTMIAAFMGGWLGRRITYALLCIGSCISLVVMYQANDTFNTQLLLSVFVAGGITAAFYGWFPLYLPELFPTKIRATSQGFAYNFGRILSALGSLQTATLTAYFSAGIAIDRIEVEAFPKAGATLSVIYLLGLVIIWFGPETKGRPLPE